MENLEGSNFGINDSITANKPAVKSIEGDVFYSRHSNLLDTIRFYQVTKMITDTTIMVRELHQMNCYCNEINYCSPITNLFISGEIEVSLSNQFILNGDDLLGKRLNHTDINISNGISIRIWEYITH